MPWTIKSNLLSVTIIPLYVGAVALVNILFLILPPISIYGGFVPPATFVVGLVFVLRDLLQKQFPHWVTFLCMGVATGLTWLLADPTVALASSLAFLIGEMTDYFVFRITRRPLRQRILISSMLSVPVESVVFLNMLGMFNLSALGLMFTCKMLASVAAFLLLPKK